MKITKRGKTKNYSMFKMAIGNRTYKESHAISLANAIKDNNLLEAFPVMCIQTKDGVEVIDGQHRLGACKILKIEVPYVIVDGVTKSDIALINGHQKQWLTKDYLNHFCQLGLTEYNQLAMFIERTQMPIALCAKILSGNVTEGGCGQRSDPFKSGKFKIKDMKLAELVFDTITAIKKAGCNFACDRSLVKAIQNIITVMPTFNYDRLCARMEYMDFKKRANWIDYCEQFDMFYNYRSPVNQRVHIMAKLSDAGLLKK